MRLLFLLLLASFSWPIQASEQIKIYVTVDWEGYSLQDDNIQEMREFRKQFPHIPILQLLNPAYFLQGYPNHQFITDTIKSTFLPSDTQGLHIHAWRSLVEHCGLTYQGQPSFANINEACTKGGDCGYTISLEYAYSAAELSKLVACSSDVLVNNGFDKPKHFRAGGWQQGPKLMQALLDNGFVWDSSRIDANLLTTRWHTQSGIITMLKKLHPNSTPLDQPYPVSEQLMEFPNNAALADYTNTKQIVQLFQDLIKAKKTVMVLGFHQETAVDYLRHLSKAIPQMEALAKENGWTIAWVAR